MVDLIIGHWKLDEESGSVANDSTSNGKHGTVTGTSIQEGLFVNARVFVAGNEDRIEIDNSENDFSFTGEDFTISTWFRTSSTPSTRYALFSKYNAATSNKSYLLNVNSSGNLSFIGSGDGTSDTVSISSGTAVNDNGWHLATITRGGSQFRLYVDGIEVSSELLGPANLFDNLEPVLIGNASQAADYDAAFDGYIDDVRVYNFTLSAKEVSELYYNTTFDPNPPYFILITPTDGQIRLSPNTDIVFKFADELPELDTLNFTVDGFTVLANGLPADGYQVYYQDFTDGYSDGYDGYMVTVAHEGWPQSVYLTGEIDATDAYGTFNYIQFQFATSDTDPPPTFNAFDPLPDSNGHDSGDSIDFQFNDGYFTTLDLVSGADITTLQTIIDGHTAILNGTIQSGFSGSIVANGFDGFNVSLYKDGGWRDGRKLEVILSGSDLNGSNAVFSYFINMGGGPVLETVYPGDGYVAVDRNTTISFEVADAIFGIDIEDISISINSLDVFINNIEYNGYIVQRTAIADGWFINIIGPTLPEYDDVLVIVTVENTAGNLAIFDYTFQTRDETTPFIEPISPQLNAERVNISTDITFRLLDGYSGINLDTLDVIISGIDAITNGVAEFGYSYDYEFITDGYLITLNPPDLEQFVVTPVFISVNDFHNNNANIVHYFSTDDTLGPVITDRDPDSGERKFGDTDIVFSVHDAGGVGALPDLLNVTIDTNPAVIDGVFQVGYTGSIVFALVGGFDGYEVTINPDVDFTLGDEVEIAIDVKDGYANQTLEVYSFIATEINPPIFINLNPAVDGVASIRPEIQFFVHDANESGVDPSTIDAYLDGFPAVLGGEIAPNFSGWVEPRIVNGFAGYAVLFQPAFFLDHNSEYLVELDAYDLQNNLGSFSYTFLTTDDSIKPFFENFMPAPGATGVSLNTNIFFQFNDQDGYLGGVNLSTFSVVVDGTQAILNGEGQNNYGVDFVENTSDGYDVTIMLPSGLPEYQYITIELDGYDASGNLNSFEYSFLTQDITPPDIVPLVPEIAQADVPYNTDIVIDILDGYSGVDLSSIDISVDGKAAVINGAAIDGYGLNVFVLPEGYTLELYGSTMNQGQVALVFVSVTDNENNYRQLAYSFTIADQTAPEFDNIYPPPFSLGVPNNTDIAFDYVDFASGVDLTRLFATVDGDPVITEGIAQGGTTLITTPMSGGYRVEIDEIFLQENQTVEVALDGYDLDGNHVNFVYTLTGLFEPPEFTNIVPNPDAVAVPIDSDIDFDFIDAYGVNLNTLNVFIFGGQAIKNGVEQDGYTVTYTPIDGGYHVNINPDDPFFEATIIGVDLQGEDNNGLPAELSYSFKTVTDDFPDFIDIFPIPFTTGQDENADILITITDLALNGIFRNSIDLYINSAPVIIDGVPQDGYTVDIIQNLDVDGYDIIVGHDRFEPYSRVFVSIQAMNLDGNNTLLEYYYDVAELSFPDVIPIDPLANATDVPVYTDICFDVVDYTGVDINGLTVTINGQIAFQDASFIYPFDDVNSSVTAIDDLEYLSVQGTIPVYDPIEAFYPPVYFSDEFFDEDLFNDGYYLDEDGYTAFDPGLVNDGTFIVDGYIDGYDGYDGYRLDGYEDGYDGYFPVPPFIGYRFCFDYRLYFTPGSVVEVVVHAADILGNEGNRTYSFTIEPDVGPPVFENVSPYPDEENVAPDRPITFSFVDAFSGAVLSTLNVTVAGRPAIVGGEFQDGYSGSTVFTGDGYDVIVIPDEGWPNYVHIPVSLYGEDLVGNSTLFEYEFLTQDLVGPVFDNIFPEPDSIDVPTDTSIRFSFDDQSQTGTNLNTLNVRVLGSLIVIDGNALDGYEITAVPNGADGYDIEIFFNSPLPEYTLIDIVLSGSDNAGNFAFLEYSWTTADESGPVFENASPIFPGPKVSGQAPIFIDILDFGSGLNLNTLGFSVDGIPVIDSGITLANGFVTELNPIEDGYRLYVQSVGSLSHEITADTVALYRMDSLILNDVENATGNVALDGTAIGPTLVTGLFDSALRFAGGNDRVEIATDAELQLQDITIEAWVNPSSLISDHTIYSYNPRQTITDGRGLFVQVTASGALQVLLGSGFGVLEYVTGTPGLISTGTYTHVAVVVSVTRGTVELYVNGAPDISIPIPVSNIEYADGAIGLPAIGAVLLGNRVNPFSGAYTDQFVGDIDDLRISGAAFDASTVANSYNRSQAITFSEYAIVPVSIFIQDYAGNDGYYDFEFRTLDETLPVFSNFDPAANTVRVYPGTNVQFDFTDIHSGPDIDTLRVVIDGNPYIEEGLGYNASVTYTAIPDGYHVDIDLDTDLPEFKNIIVTIDGYDIDPNYATVTYQFSTDDLTPPVLVDELPEDGATSVNPFTDVEFTLHDFNASGVDNGTVSVQIDDTDAIIDGVPQSGWGVDITPVFFDGYDGYRYSLNPPFRFALNSNIRVLVDGYDAYGNYFASDFAFTTYDDQDAPQIVNLDPYPDEIEVEINRDVSFDIIDGYDVDMSRLDVHITNMPAILGGVFQPGFQGDSGGISQIQDGYSITIDPEYYFAYNQQVTVVIDGYDFSDNHVHFEYYFYTFADVAGPIISNRNPDINEVEVVLNSDVEFNITDPAGTGVDMTRLDVHIDEHPAVIDGVIQSGWDGPSSGIEVITDGYHVVLDPVGSFAFDYNQIHVVTIDGYDYADNHTNDIYAFATISDPNAPTLDNFDPAPDEEEVPVATDISFDITDTVSGVDITRLDVYVNGVPAITDGTITSPFNDTNAGIFTIVDGYNVVLDLFSDFYWNEYQDVVIDAYDYADNHVHFEYTFLTKVDVDGPVITPINPLNSVGDYPRDTDIALSVTDTETGVDFTRFNVTIDNILAMESGEFVSGSGFDGANSIVTQLIDGYEVFFDSTTVFPPNYTVRVVADGYDFANNHTHFEYIFTTIDDEGPIVFDFSPIPNSVDAENDPVHVMFGIKDSGGGEVNLGTLVIQVAEEADGPYITVFEPINEFQNGWVGNITNQPDGDGYIVDLTRVDQGESFALYTFRITASDNKNNTTVTDIGNQGGFVDSGTGTVTGVYTLEVGEFFLNSNQIDVGDIGIITGVGALVVDGYTATEIVFDRQIAAGGVVSFQVFRGSFMLERRIFRPETAVPTSTILLDLTYSDPPFINAAVLDPISYTVTGGDYPVTVIDVTQSDDDTFELTFDVPTQALVLYTLTVDSNTILNQIGFSIDDGYESITFFGFPDVEGPRVLSAENAPFNINITLVFDEAMTYNTALTTPGNYLISDGAYVTSVVFDPTENDRVVLTVENLFGRLEFDVFVVSEDIIDVFGNSLDLEYNHAIVRLQETTAALSGLTGRIKTRNAIRRLYEDHTNWYLATEGGIDVVGKLDLENKGFVLDGYGFNAITANVDAIYFGSNDGYDVDSYGVHKLTFIDLNRDSTNRVVDAFNTMSVPAILSNEINDVQSGTHASDQLLAVATPAGASVITNDATVIHYSSGNEIVGVHLDDAGEILYIANNTLGRVEVYYNIHLDIVDRPTPDVYYDISTSPEISNAVINQIKITNNTSVIDSESNTIYVATDYGLTKIDTDESVPGASESGGISFIYGIEGSGATFEILGGEVNRVVAVDINLQQRQIFVATDDPSHNGGLTTINIPSNTQFSFANDQRGTLVSNDVRDIVFKNL